ncbi:hypothetical protein ACJX0J_012604 [Zea mays]
MILIHKDNWDIDTFIALCINFCKDPIIILVPISVNFVVTFFLNFILPKIFDQSFNILHMLHICLASGYFLLTRIMHMQKFIVGYIHMHFVKTTSDHNVFGSKWLYNKWMNLYNSVDTACTQSQSQWFDKEYVILKCFQVQKWYSSAQQKKWKNSCTRKRFLTKSMENN